MGSVKIRLSLRH